MPRLNAAPILDAGDSINRGLRGFWPLTENGGAFVRDISPFRWHGRAQNSPEFRVASPPASGKTAFFGAGDYIDIPSFRWPGGCGVTVSFWTKTGTNGNNRPFGVGPTPTYEPNLFFAHVPYFDNTLYWRYGTYGTDVTTSFAAYLDKWTHVALVNNGVNFKAIYLNGVLVASGTNVATPPVACAGMTLGDGSWTGALSGLRIHTRALSGREIRRLAGDPWAGTLRRQRPKLISASGTTYSSSITDTATGGEALATALTTAGAVSDAATGAGTVAGVLAMSSAASDAATAADSASATHTQPATISGAVTGAESLASALTTAGAVSDSASGADALASAHTMPAALSDAATGAESLSSALTTAGAVSDSAAAADSTTGDIGAATYNVSISDAVTAADALASAHTMPATIAGSVAAAEALTGGITITAAISGAATAGEAIAVTLAAAAGISDSASSLDAIASALAASEIIVAPVVAAGAFDISVGGEALFPAPAYRTVRALLRARAAVARAEDRTITAPYRTRTISAEE